MRAYVTSIGEPTTDLCKWSLERMGFDVVVVKNDSSLADKLATIFRVEDDDFIRVDADVVPNRNVLELINMSEAWWYQTQSFDWFAQDVRYGGVQFIRKEAIPIIREHLDDIADLERPESYLYRLDEFHNPRRCVSWDKVCGVHGYAQTDVNRIKKTKGRRGQYDTYDWELSDRMSAL